MECLRFGGFEPSGGSPVEKTEIFRIIMLGVGDTGFLMRCRNFFRVGVFGEL